MRCPESTDRTRLAVRNAFGHDRRPPETSRLMRTVGPVQPSVAPTGDPMVDASTRAVHAVATVTSGAATWLVERAQSGDHYAFDALVERELHGAHRTARAILGNDADARDATQEAFIHAWRELPRLRDPERFDAWLRAIVVNSCRKALRGRRRRQVREIAIGDPIEQLADVASRDQAPDDQVAATEALERSFERLSADERAILVLHHLERQTLVEIAATLAIPVGTAKSRLSAARRQLEQALEVELT
jgi:RNA polymerase sigma factor (sigma-70 family)